MKRDDIHTTIELDEITSVVLNALDTHVAILNPNGDVVAFNTPWSIFRKEIEESWSHPALEANILKSLQTPLAQGNDFALRLLLGIKDILSGETNTFETKYFLSQEDHRQSFKVSVKSLGTNKGAVLIYDDITSQIQSTRYLKEAKHKFESHFHNSLYGILVTDEDHTIIEANNVACNILESDLKSIAFSDISDFLEIDLDASQIQKKINRQGNYLGEKEIVTANGTKLPIELSVTLFRNEDGKKITSWAFKDISDKKNTEQALKATEQQYKLQFNNTLEGIIIGRPDGQILLINPAACDILGYKAEELEGKHRDIVFNASVPANKKALQKRRTDGSFTGEVEFTHKNGHAIPVEVSSAIFMGEDGSEKTIVSLKDISARKEIEKQLIEEKEFTESAISSLPTAFFVFSRKGEFIRWNDVLEKDLGYTARELALMNAIEIIHPDDRHLLQDILKGELIGKRVSLEVRCLTKSGHTLHYLISGTSFIQNGETYIVGGGLNRNDFKEIENEKNRNAELLDQLFFNSPIGIALVDTNGKVKNINKSFEKIFGYSQEEVKGRDINNTIVPTDMDDQAKAFSHLSYTGDSFQSEAIRIAKDGTEVPVLIGGVPVEIDGEVIAIYGMYVDISERKHLEDQVVELLEAEKKARLHMEDMFEEAPSAIAMLEGGNHTITFVNETFRQLVGKTNLIGSTVHDALPELEGQGLMELLDACYREGKPLFFYEKEVYFNIDGKKSISYLNFVYKPLRNEEGDVYGIFVQGIDVTEQVQARNIIEKSLAEKNTLLGEVHHRVKNNLAIISGLLELDLMGSQNKDVVKHLTSTQSRIKTIAKIHELLYQNESLSHVSFKKYLESMLCNETDKEFGAFKTFELEDITLNVNQAIPAGILLNEIIACIKNINVREYDGGPADFSFSLHKKNDTVYIDIKEGAKKIIEWFGESDDSENGLRMELIDILLRQIRGDMEIIGTDQKSIRIHFDKRELKGPHSALNN